MDPRLTGTEDIVPAAVDAPLIGITTSELRKREALDHEGEPPQVDATLGFAYVEAVVRAGGAPVIVAPLAPTASSALLARLDGLLLSGGPDVHPSAYGEMPDEQLGDTEPEVDLFELSLCRSAIAQEVPVLAICRGAQLLNVAEGGTLHQHIPDVFGTAIEHRQTPPGWQATHAVSVTPDSALGALFGPGSLMVNSFHHQAIDRLAPSLHVAARSADGVIEAIERPGPAFCRGVQWHAESLVGELQQLWLFEAFVAAAQERQAGGRPAMRPVRSDGAVAA